MGGSDLTCSGLVIVSIIMAILILGKEYAFFWPKLPDFLSNFINTLISSLSMDGLMVKCKLTDKSGNDHGVVKPPKNTHIAQDIKDQREKENAKRAENGTPSDPLQDYDEEKLMALEKARELEVKFKNKSRETLSKLEGFEVKKSTVNPQAGENEVFNVDKNLFEFKEAEAVCKYYNAELATYDQVKQAYDKGANWCNYGWVKTGQAVYPIQKDFYDKLSEEQKKNNHCGPGPGIVGGFMPSHSIRLGVNCYGKKPDADPNRILSVDADTDKFIDNEKNQLANQIANKIYENKVDFKPFSDSSYSTFSTEKTKYLDSGMANNEEQTLDTIKEEPDVTEKTNSKELVETFIFENKGLSEEFYRTIGRN